MDGGGRVLWTVLFLPWRVFLSNRLLRVGEWLFRGFDAAWSELPGNLEFPLLEMQQSNREFLESQMR